MSFPQFALLPPELQLRIWQFNLPPPRVVDLYAVPVSESLQPRFQPKPKSNTSATKSTSTSSQFANSTSSSSAGQTPDSDENEEIPPLSPIWIRTFIERIYTAPKDLQCLHVCAEARRIALKHYVKLNADTGFKGEMKFQCLEPVKAADGSETMFCQGTLKGNRPYAILDPTRDVVFLQDPPRMLDSIGGLVISNLEIMMRWLPMPIERLKRLAVPYYTWRKTRDSGGLGLLMHFGGLEELWVSFLGDSWKGGKQRATWSDMVGAPHLWSHVREVEEEVTADVEGLKRRFPEWMVPRVRVVKHRGVLVEELRG